MRRHFGVFKLVLSFIIPYFILYALYIQLNGDASVGGGFQSGVIFASVVVAFDLINLSKKTYKIFSKKNLIICGVLGVLIYTFTGLISFIFNDNYLNYSSIARILGIKDPIWGQYLGIFFIESGVGLTVSSIMSLIFFLLKED